MSFGTAQGGAFILQNATIMLGDLGDGEDLIPELHSLGLFKEATVNIARTFTSLAQGVRQQKVDEQLTGEDITVTGKGYEFGAKQLTYALGQDGHGLTSTGLRTTNTLAVTSGGTDLTLASVTGLAVGDYLVVAPNGDSDAGLVVVISSLTGLVVGLDRPLAMAIPLGSHVTKSRITLVGGDNYVNTYKSMKVTSAAVNGDPIVMIFPKVKVTSSFTLGLSSQDYASTPFTFQSYAMTPAEIGYAQYRANGRAEMWQLTRG